MEPIRGKKGSISECKPRGNELAYSSPGAWVGGPQGEGVDEFGAGSRALACLGRRQKTMMEMGVSPLLFIDVFWLYLLGRQTGRRPCTRSVASRHTHYVWRTQGSFGLSPDSADSNSRPGMAAQKMAWELERAKNPPKHRACGLRRLLAI